MFDSKRKFIFLKSSSGQSMIEFLIFMPFLFVSLTILLSIGASINGSINQQKAARGYFFSLNKNKSSLLLISDLEMQKTNGIQYSGLSATGWADKMINEVTPQGPCYKISPLGVITSEKCDEKFSDRSSFIKVFTVFGICSGTYDLRHDNQVLLSWTTDSFRGCTLSK